MVAALVSSRVSPLQSMISLHKCSSCDVTNLFESGSCFISLCHVLTMITPWPLSLSPNHFVTAWPTFKEAMVTVLPIINVPPFCNTYSKRIFGITFVHRFHSGVSHREVLK